MIHVLPPVVLLMYVTGCGGGGPPEAEEVFGTNRRIQPLSPQVVELCLPN